MPLNDPQRKLLEDYNHTLAIIGKFRIAPANERRLEFASGRAEDSTGGPLRSATLFATLRPELRLNDQAQLRIGDALYNEYTLGTPRQPGRDSRPMELTADSPLLDVARELAGGGDQARAIQRIGGRIFGQVLRDADVIARFGHTHFARALNTIANYYLRIEGARICKGLANRGPRPGVQIQVSNATLESLMKEDPGSAEALVAYLCCTPGDDARALQSVRAALTGKRLSEDLETERRIVDALVQALDRLKNVVLAGGDKASTDASWLELQHQPEFGSGWLDNYALHEVYGVATGLGANVGNPNSFISSYQVYRKHADSLHRYIRTPPLHAFVVCWLAAKYAPHGRASTIQAAQAMYDDSIASMDDKRVVGESQKDRLANAELSIKASKESIKTARAGLAENVRDNYGDHADLVQVLILDVLNPIRSFGTAELARKLESLFVNLGQLTGGPVAAIHEENGRLRERLVRFRTAILSAKAPDDSHLTLDDFASLLRREAGKNEDEVAFVEAVISRATATALEDPSASKSGPEAERASRRLVKQAFVQEFTTGCHEHFAAAFNGKAGEISTQAEALRQAYRLRARISLSASTSQAGLPVVIVDELPAANARRDERVRTRKNKRAHAEARVNRQTPSPVFRLPLPKQQPEGLPPSPMQLLNPEAPSEEISGTITESGKQIGSVTVSSSGVEVTVTEVKDLPLLGTSDALLSIVANGKTHEWSSEVLNANGELQRNQEAYRRQQEQILPGNLLPDYDPKKPSAFNRMADTGDLIQKLFVSDGKPRNAALDAFRRRTRAWTFGEFLAATPGELSPLDKPDVSQGVGITMDLLDRVADIENAATLCEPIPDGKTSERLKLLNLSPFFPVSADEVDGPAELSDILQFHYKLAQSTTDVAAYLSQVIDLRSAFEAVRDDPKLRIVLYNETLEEHGNRVNVSTRVMGVHDRPCILYLPAEANVTAVGLNLLAGNHEEARNGGNKVTYPIVLCQERINPTSCALPILTGASLDLPMLKPGLFAAPQDTAVGEGNKSEPERARQTTATQAVEIQVDSLDVPSPLLALALSLVAKAGFPGNPVHEIDMDSAKRLRQAGIQWDAAKPLADAFRLLWAGELGGAPIPANSPNAKLFHHAVLVRLVNLALLNAEPNRPAFKSICDALGLGGDEAARKAAQATVDALFSAPGLEFLRGLSVSPSHQVGTPVHKSSVALIGPDWGCTFTRSNGTIATSGPFSIGTWVTSLKL